MFIRRGHRMRLYWCFGSRLDTAVYQTFKERRRDVARHVLGLNRTIRVGAGLTEMKRLGVAALQLMLTLAPLGGGPKGPPPCGFSQIAPEVLGISLWNLPYLSGQQFHTLCQKIRTQVIIGQPWVTSEWRHVSPILINKMGLRESPPLVQF